MGIRKRVKNLLEPGEGLYQRVVRGGAWVFALRITNQGFRIVRLIVLARVLVPNDFGLIGIALLAMATLETLSATGFNQALIQKKGEIQHYLDAAWTVSVLRGLILFIILFFTAPYIAILFDAPMAIPIIRVIGIVSLLQGLINIGVIYFQKELEFNKQFFYEFSSTLADFAVAISAVIILRSAWALVFGLLAATIVRLIVSYFIHPDRPHLSLDLGKVKELFGFGKWILGSSMLIFLLTQGDDIFVGKLLGVTLLGFYQMAYRFSNTPATEITHVISQVTFPAYSKLQDNLPSLRDAYLKTLQLTALIAVPLAGGIFILAPEFTQLFLGDKWIPMVPAMQALALWGLLRSIGATTGPIFQAVGKPNINTKVQLSELIILAILIYPFSIRWGILGTSLAVFFAGLAGNLIMAPWVIKLIKCGTWHFSKIILLPLMNTGVMISSIFILKMYLFYPIGLLEFILLIILGIIIYSGIAYLFDRYLGYGIQSTIMEILTSF